MLGGTDVTGQLRGGQIGANIALRDTTLPTDQAELDEFAQNLASRFDAQGLTLFTDPDGNAAGGYAAAPVQSGYVGFAGTIQVNPGGADRPFAGARRHRRGASGRPGAVGRLHRHHQQRVLNLHFGAAAAGCRSRRRTPQAWARRAI